MEGPPPVRTVTLHSCSYKRSRPPHPRTVILYHRSCIPPQVPRADNRSKIFLWHLHHTHSKSQPSIDHRRRQGTLLGTDFFSHHGANRRLLNVTTFQASPLGYINHCPVRADDPYGLFNQGFLKIFLPDLRQQLGQAAKHGAFHRQRDLWCTPSLDACHLRSFKQPSTPFLKSHVYRLCTSPRNLTGLGNLKVTNDA